MKPHRPRGLDSERAQRQVHRLLTMALYLSARRHWVEIAALSALGGVCPRTTRRDLAVLDRLGATIVFSGEAPAAVRFRWDVARSLTRSA